MGSAAARPHEDSCFIYATGKIDAKVERFSNHSFLAWEVDIPAGREKYDANRFADDFRTFFGLNYMTHLQDPENIPKVMWLTVANPDPVQDSINIPWVQAEPYDSTVAGVNQPHCRSFEWRLGVPDGEDVRAPPLDARACNQRTQRCRGHVDDDERGNEDYYQQRRRSARSIWARMGCKEGMNVHCAGARGRNTSADSSGHRRHCCPQHGASNIFSACVGRHSARLAAKNPDGKGASTLALQVLAKKLGVASNSLESNSQKLGTLFKQQLSPSAVRAIRELVALGGD
ncbi:hypothetical protein GUJ93_ZPchr0006g41661 [Zizania palustris]|uniref:Uncharacterized protein n=1 Tax=Zizania palustris TaxID=103762 RepID=A0A8J5W2Q0_ZIZPA|nr:hypothetical protein GUJ93_ZPchr0006g41661 [Zizania palustris]